jgi:hypothetical protein
MVDFPGVLEFADEHGEGDVFKRLPSVKTQVLRSEVVLAIQLFTCTPKPVQRTGFPTVVFFAETVFAV